MSFKNFYYLPLPRQGKLFYYLSFPLSLFGAHCAEDVILNNATYGTVRARARAARMRGFLGGLERFALTPPKSFSWYRSFATQKNDTPRRGSGKSK